METQELKQRTRDEPDMPTTDKTDVATTDNTKTNEEIENINKSKPDRRKAMAKRGLKSLAVMVTVPVLFTLASTSTLLGSTHSYDKLDKPFWLPPIWALHWATLVNSFLMGLSAWLVWVEGEFHRRPRVFQLYLAWLLLSLAWDPIVLGYGANRTGLVVVSAMIAALAWCCRVFMEVNPIAGDLVIPCLALSGLLALINLTLLCT